MIDHLINNRIRPFRLPPWFTCCYHGSLAAAQANALNVAQLLDELNSRKVWVSGLNKKEMATKLIENMQGKPLQVELMIPFIDQYITKYINASPRVHYWTNEELTRAMFTF